MNCRACRFSLPEEAVFCPDCGEKVVVEREPVAVPQGDRRVVAAGGAAGLSPQERGSVDVPQRPPAAAPGGSAPATIRTDSESRRPPREPGPAPSDASRGARPTPGVQRATPRASVDALLARANLLRMRGQWAEAVECCTEALRLDPHSAAAHSLLGDIYENQGRLDKASHWYQLALEQHPDSIADQAKLARVKELQAVRRRTGDPRFSWAYLVAVAGVAFLFVAFVMAALVARDRNRPVSTILAGKDMPQFPPSAPPRSQPLHHTTEEEKLVLHLQERLNSKYMRVELATLDPLDQDVLITVRLTERPIPPDPTTGSRRDYLLREVYRIGYLSRLQQLERRRDLRFATVRAVTKLSSGSGDDPVEEVWRGRMDVTRAIVEDDRASVNEVRGVYVGRMYSNPIAGF